MPWIEPGDPPEVAMWAMLPQYEKLALRSRLKSHPRV